MQGPRDAKIPITSIFDSPKALSSSAGGQLEAVCAWGAAPGPSSTAPAAPMGTGRSAKSSQAALPAAHSAACAWACRTASTMAGPNWRFIWSLMPEMSRRSSASCVAGARLASCEKGEEGRFRRPRSAAPSAPPRPRRTHRGLNGPVEGPMDGAALLLDGGVELLHGRQKQALLEFLDGKEGKCNG